MRKSNGFTRITGRRIQGGLRSSTNVRLYFGNGNR